MTNENDITYLLRRREEILIVLDIVININATSYPLSFSNIYKN